MRHVSQVDHLRSQTFSEGSDHMGPKVISTKFQIDCDKHATTGSNPSFNSIIYLLLLLILIKRLITVKEKSFNYKR